MKRTILVFSCLLLLTASSFAYLPNEKVLKSFESIFNNPQDVKWFDKPDCYEVSFIQSDIRANVKFDPEGNFMGSTRYYKEQNLPTSILCKLKKRYSDRNIFGVTEISTSDEVNYYIKLEDDKSWVTVKVNGNGQMELIEKYRKA
ncbi:MAG: hypothetical protein ABIN89_25285 [Chitinophagaceae bacterium]